jgi:hypothetical protein
MVALILVVIVADKLAYQATAPKGTYSRPEVARR